MTSMTLDLPRRIPWAAMLSVGIHGAAVAGLLYMSVHQVIELPAPAQPISVTMVSPAELEPPQVVQPQPEPVVEPEPEPEPEPVPEPPKEAPVVIQKPEPKPKPKPKPKPEKKVEQPKRDVKPVEKPAAAPIQNAPVRTVTNTTPPASTTPAPSVPTGPRAVSRNQPTYPERARVLRIEGRVRVKFDVTMDGRLDNVEIVSAQPSNLFEREVKSAMRRWRYEAGKPGKGIYVTIVFRMDGTSTME